MPRRVVSTLLDPRLVLVFGGLFSALTGCTGSEPRSPIDRPDEVEDARAPTPDGRMDAAVRPDTATPAPDAPPVMDAAPDRFDASADMTKIPDAAPDVQPDAGGGDKPAAGGFAPVHALLTKYCAECHENAGNEYLFHHDMAENHEYLLSEKSARACAKMSYIAAGMPMASVVYRKMVNTSCGARMPQGGPFLTTTELKVIEDWIKAGAKL